MKGSKRCGSKSDPPNPTPSPEQEHNTDSLAVGEGKAPKRRTKAQTLASPKCSLSTSSVTSTAVPGGDKLPDSSVPPGRCRKRSTDAAVSPKQPKGKRRKASETCESSASGQSLREGQEIPSQDETIHTNKNRGKINNIRQRVQMKGKKSMEKTSDGDSNTPVNQDFARPVEKSLLKTVLSKDVNEYRSGETSTEALGFSALNTENMNKRAKKDISSLNYIAENTLVTKKTTKVLASTKKRAQKKSRPKAFKKRAATNVAKEVIPEMQGFEIVIDNPESDIPAAFREQNTFAPEPPLVTSSRVPSPIQFQIGVSSGSNKGTSCQTWERRTSEHEEFSLNFMCDVFDDTEDTIPQYDTLAWDAEDEYEEEFSAELQPPLGLVISNVQSLSDNPELSDHFSSRDDDIEPSFYYGQVAVMNAKSLSDASKATEPCSAPENVLGSETNRPGGGGVSQSELYREKTSSPSGLEILDDLANQSWVTDEENVEPMTMDDDIEPNDNHDVLFQLNKNPGKESEVPSLCVKTPTHGIAASVVFIQKIDQDITDGILLDRKVCCVLEGDKLVLRDHLQESNKPILDDSIIHDVAKEDSHPPVLNTVTPTLVLSTEKSESVDKINASDKQSEHKVGTAEDVGQKSTENVEGVKTQETTGHQRPSHELEPIQGLLLPKNYKIPRKARTDDDSKEFKRKTLGSSPIFKNKDHEKDKKRNHRHKKSHKKEEKKKLKKTEFDFAGSLFKDHSMSKLKSKKKIKHRVFSEENICTTENVQSEKKLEKKTEEKIHVQTKHKKKMSALNDTFAEENFEPDYDENLDNSFVFNKKIVHNEESSHMDPSSDYHDKNETASVSKQQGDEVSVVPELLDLTTEFLDDEAVEPDLALDQTKLDKTSDTEDVYGDPNGPHQFSCGDNDLSWSDAEFDRCSGTSTPSLISNPPLEENTLPTPENNLSEQTIPETETSTEPLGRKRVRKWRTMSSSPPPKLKRPIIRRTKSLVPPMSMEKKLEEGGSDGDILDDLEEPEFEPDSNLSPDEDEHYDSISIHAPTEATFLDNSFQSTKPQLSFNLEESSGCTRIDSWVSSKIPASRTPQVMGRPDVISHVAETFITQDPEPEVQQTREGEVHEEGKQNICEPLVRDSETHPEAKDHSDKLKDLPNKSEDLMAKFYSISTESLPPRENIEILQLKALGERKNWSKLARMIVNKDLTLAPLLPNLAGWLFSEEETGQNYTTFVKEVIALETKGTPKNSRRQLGNLGLGLVRACYDKGLWKSGHQIITTMFSHGFKFLNPSAHSAANLCIAVLRTAQTCIKVRNIDGAAQILNKSDWLQQHYKTLEEINEKGELIELLKTMLPVLYQQLFNLTKEDASQHKNLAVGIRAIETLAVMGSIDLDSIYNQWVEMAVNKGAISRALSLYKIHNKHKTIHIMPAVLRMLIKTTYHEGKRDYKMYEKSHFLAYKGLGSLYPYTELHNASNLKPMIQLHIGMESWELHLLVEMCLVRLMDLYIKDRSDFTQIEVQITLVVNNFHTKRVDMHDVFKLRSKMDVINELRLVLHNDLNPPMHEIHSVGDNKLVLNSKEVKSFWQQTYNRIAENMPPHKPETLPMQPPLLPRPQPTEPSCQNTGRGRDPRQNRGPSSSTGPEFKEPPPPRRITNMRFKAPHSGNKYDQPTRGKSFARGRGRGRGGGSYRSADWAGGDKNWIPTSVKFQGERGMWVGGEESQSNGGYHQARQGFNTSRDRWQDQSGDAREYTMNMRPPGPPGRGGPYMGNCHPQFRGPPPSRGRNMYRENIHHRGGGSARDDNRFYDRHHENRDDGPPFNNNNMDGDRKLIPYGLSKPFRETPSELRVRLEKIIKERLQFHVRQGHLFEDAMWDWQKSLEAEIMEKPHLWDASRTIVEKIVDEKVHAGYPQL